MKLKNVTKNELCLTGLKKPLQLIKRKSQLHLHVQHYMKLKRHTCKSCICIYTIYFWNPLPLKADSLVL